MGDQANLSGADLLFGEETIDDPVSEVEDGAETAQAQAEEEPAPDDDNVAGVEDADGEEDLSEDSEESDDEESTDDEDDEVLYLDLDGEEHSLDEVREWKKSKDFERNYTQKRMADAKREKLNIANEARINERLQRTEAINEAIDGFVSNLRKEGLYTEEELDELTKKAGELQSKKAEDAQAFRDSKAAYELDLLQKRNKTWFDESGQYSEVGKEQVTLINDWLEKEGFTKEEVAFMENHKVIMAIHKAAQFDKLKKKTVDIKKKVKKIPVSSKPKPKPKAPPKPKTAEESVFGEF